MGDLRGRSERAVLVVLAMMMLGTACASEIEFEDAETEERFSAGLEQSAEVRVSNQPFTPGEELCIQAETGGDADFFVAVVAGVGAEGDAARTALANAVLACVDDVGQHEGFVEQIRANLSAGLGTGIELSTAETSCTVSYLAENSANFGRAIAVGTDPEDLDLLFSAAELCFEPETLATLYGEAGTGPQIYGDDIGLDALFDACEQGNEAGCDLLYIDSSVGSEYNNLAIDCAGRGDGLAMCTPGLVYADDGFVDTGSPGVADLSDACQAGDMLACDLVFFVSEPGSATEVVGTSCGGKISVAIPDCRTRFPS